MMIIGITGSHGFIGQNLVNFLKGLPGIEIRRFDRNRHSLFNVSSLKAFVEGLDILFHLAGANRAEDSELIRINIAGTSNLLEAVKRHGRPDDIRFIFTSSFQVYAPRNSVDPLMDTAVPSPQNLFGITKRCAEDLIRISGIRSAVLRLSNVYGPLCRPFYNSVIATFCHLMLHNKDLVMHGDGNQTRDFIFIDDVISALAKLIYSDFKKAEVFNLCSGDLISLNSIIKELEKISGVKARIQYAGEVQSPGHLCGENIKIRKTLGWRVGTPFSLGLQKTYAWFENRGCVKPAPLKGYNNFKKGRRVRN